MANDPDDLRSLATQINYETAVSAGRVNRATVEWISGESNDAIRRRKIADEVNSYYEWLEEQKKKEE